MRLLLVEDTDRLRNTLTRSLSADGHVVDAAASGRQAIAFLDGYDYDIVVLDLMLPDMDGLDVLRRLRKGRGGARVMILSARDQVADRVESLNLGADDYLVKPFAHSELAARLLALGRRRLDDGGSRLEVGPLQVDLLQRVARVNEQMLSLSPKEYALVELLLRERGRVLSRAQIFERLYDSGSAASDKVVEVLMSTLRTKLARAGVPEIVQNRRGHGYVVA
jgi:two-component system copper resistance phosphate regulon response regulator CusR